MSTVNSTATAPVTMKGATTKRELLSAIKADLSKHLFQPLEIGAIVKGSKDTSLRVYSSENSVAFERSNGKSVYNLRSNCFSKSYAEVEAEVIALIQAHPTATVDELREMYYEYKNETVYEASVWEDNKDCHSILAGAPIEGRLCLDKWTDENTGEMRERVRIDRVRDITVRVSASSAPTESSAFDALFSMVDDSVKVSKPVTKRRTVKA